MRTDRSAERFEGMDNGGISRRDLLLGAGALGGLAAAGMAVAKEDHSKHDHSKHMPQQPDLLAAVNDCLDKGRRCISHCLVVFQEGDTSLADCAAKVHEMYAICDAYAYLLSANSTYGKEYSAICARVCDDCEKECRKHEKHHECRACAEACAEVIAMIRHAYA